MGRSREADPRRSENGEAKEGASVLCLKGCEAPELNAAGLCTCGELSEF